MISPFRTTRVEPLPRIRELLREQISSAVGHIQGCIYRINVFVSLREAPAPAEPEQACRVVIQRSRKAPIVVEECDANTETLVARIVARIRGSFAKPSDSSSANVQVFRHVDLKIWNCGFIKP